MTAMILVAIGVTLVLAVIVCVLYFLWSVNIPDYIAARHYRFGKPSAEGTVSGRRVLVIPSVDMLVMIDKRIQKSALDNIPVLTKERQQMTLSLTLVWKPSEPAVTIENIRPEDIEPTFFKIAESVIKSESAKMTVDEILENRSLLAKNLNEILSETTKGWGILVSSVNVSNLAVKNESFMRNMALPREIELERQTQMAQLEKDLAIEMKTIEKNRSSELYKLEVDKAVGLKKEEVVSAIEQAQKERERFVCELQEHVERVKSNISLMQQNTESAAASQRIRDSVLAETEGLREKLALINALNPNALNFELIKVLPEMYKNLKIGDVTLIGSGGTSGDGNFDLYSGIMGSILPIVSKLGAGKQHRHLKSDLGAEADGECVPT